MLIKLALLAALAALLALLAAWYVCFFPGPSAGAGARAADPARVLRLQRSVAALAGEIGPRSLARGDSLERAADWIEAEFRALPLSFISYFQEVRGRECRIVEATLAGDGRLPGVVVLGAHYDSVDSTPGANDNASGVAALLELARELAARGAQARALRFVAFPNEEPPYFQTGDMGSLHYARLCRDRGDDVTAMIALECLGCFRQEPGSQRYPPPLDWLYPDRGNFVAFVGDLGSRALVRRAIGAFRAAAALPSEGAALPGALPGVSWSDHWSFRQASYDAIMVTDTALFRDECYHEPGDLPERVDCEALGRAVDGLVAVVCDLANR